MSARTLQFTVLASALLAVLPASAQSLLVRGATVHTGTAQGTLQQADVLVENYKVGTLKRAILQML